MTQEQVVTAWLNDIQYYQAVKDRHQALVEWGAKLCKWPDAIVIEDQLPPPPPVPPGEVSASNYVYVTGGIY